jgi:hypothetical protein
METSKNQHGSGFSSLAASIPVPTVKTIQRFLELVECLFVSLDIMQYAEGGDLPEEPDPNDFLDHNDYEAAMRLHEAEVDRELSKIRYGIGEVTKLLLLSSDYHSQGMLILKARPAWPIQQVWTYMRAGFVIPTDSTIDKIRSSWFESSQRKKHESFEQWHIRLSELRLHYQTLTGDNISDAMFLSRLVTKARLDYEVKLASYIKKIEKSIRRNRPDRLPNVADIIRVCKGFEQDNLLFESKESELKTEKKKEKKKAKHDDQALVANKGEKAKLEAHKQASIPTTKQSSPNPPPSSSDQFAKPCFNFQRRGMCKFGDKCRYLHVVNDSHFTNNNYRSNNNYGRYNNNNNFNNNGNNYNYGSNNNQGYNNNKRIRRNFDQHSSQFHNQRQGYVDMQSNMPMQAHMTQPVPMIPMQYQMVPQPLTPSSSFMSSSNVQPTRWAQPTPSSGIPGGYVMCPSDGTYDFRYCSSPVSSVSSNSFFPIYTTATQSTSTPCMYTTYVSTPIPTHSFPVSRSRSRSPDPLRL